MAFSAPRARRTQAAVPAQSDEILYDDDKKHDHPSSTSYVPPLPASGRAMGFERKSSLSNSWIQPTNSKIRPKGKVSQGPIDFLGGGFNISSGEFKLLIVVTLLATVVRLWKLSRPTSVVCVISLLGHYIPNWQIMSSFDEVHFGGFATKYIKSKFFMDVHPPLAKLLLTLAAFLAGFRGDFDFKEIGLYVRQSQRNADLN